MTYMQHQVDRIRHEIEKKVAENNKFQNFIKKGTLADERIHKRDEPEILHGKIISKTRSKIINAKHGR